LAQVYFQEFLLYFPWRLEFFSFGPKLPGYLGNYFPRFFKNRKGKFLGFPFVRGFPSLVKFFLTHSNNPGTELIPLGIFPGYRIFFGILSQFLFFSGGPKLVTPLGGILGVGFFYPKGLPIFPLGIFF